jgi:hypothetical protein
MLTIPMGSGTPAPRPFSRSVQSRGRPAPYAEGDERVTGVFTQKVCVHGSKEPWKEPLPHGKDINLISQTGALEFAVGQRKQRQRDFNPPGKLPRFTRTLRLPYLRSVVKRNRSLFYTETTQITQSGTQVRQRQQRTSYNVTGEGNIRAVSNQSKLHEPLEKPEHLVAAEERKTRTDVEPEDDSVEKEGNRKHTQPTNTDPPADCHTTESLYPAGLPWRPFPIKTLRLSKVESDLSSHCHLSIDLKAWRRNFLRTLATTQSVPEAWEAYSNLLSLSYDVPVGKPSIPYAHMHRLFRILARNRPKTRTQFLRLLSVLHAIREAGGDIKLHEWNALIDGAGKGWRMTGIDEYRAALGIYQDMITGRAPGKSIARDDEDEREPRSPPIEPDIYTYSILISIASRTLHASAFRHAASLLAASGLPPNRITHLSLLRYFTLTKQLSGVRSTLLKMQEQNLELGLDGVNACLWSYGRNGRVDLVMMIYRLFRHNMVPELYVGEDDVASVARRLRVEEHIIIPPDMKPNEVTFTTVIQILAHHGNLLATLTVFMDMVSSQNLEMGAPLVPDDTGLLKPVPYSPTLPTFRAIFLGFARHGVRLLEDGTAPPQFRATNPPGQPAWSLTNLEALFDTFLALPEHITPNRSIVYWIMVAFERTSGNNVALLRQVWKQLETRFKGPWGGPKNRLRRIRAKLFPGEEGCVDKNRREA